MLQLQLVLQLQLFIFLLKRVPKHLLLNFLLLFQLKMERKRKTRREINTRIRIAMKTKWIHFIFVQFLNSIEGTGDTASVHVTGAFASADICLRARRWFRASHWQTRARGVSVQRKEMRAETMRKQRQAIHIRERTFPVKCVIDESKSLWKRVFPQMSGSMT